MAENHIGVPQAGADDMTFEEALNEQESGYRLPVVRLVPPPLDVLPAA
ncbi:MAG TPA: hypothetical protein VGC18_11510 [Lacisediminihabitans sp.]